MLWGAWSLKVRLLKHYIKRWRSKCEKNNSGSRGHRILMYHSITAEKFDACRDLFTVSIANFKKQMHWLKDTYGTQCIPIHSPGDIDSMKISITFDDGFADNESLVLPVMEELNLPFCIFISSGFIEKKISNYLTEVQIKKLANHPLVTIGSHGQSHRPLVELAKEEMIQELIKSKSFLSEICGYPVQFLSLPHGLYNDFIIEKAMEVGYQKIFGSNFGLNLAVQNPMMRCDIQGLDSFNDFTNKINGSWDWLGNRQKARNYHS
jgi:peptidoglycan/xylan/chitin deacetylase (PgdA/CDA1 family)